jgi:hypothetical protein
LKEHVHAQEHERRRCREAGDDHPFADDPTSTLVSDLTIENRLDRVSLYGSLELTCDRQGLENARRL